MKTQVLKKAQIKLANNFPDYTYSDELLGVYFDDAIDIIMEWKKYTKESSVYNGNYDSKVVKFIIESLNVSGLEGQSSSSANNNSKTFIATPEANLKASIPQTI